jgi:hypothetical protein
MKLLQADVREATHVLFNDAIHEIKEKWGIRENGTFKPPSEGGFGVVTTGGLHINMWQASRYFDTE